MAREPADPIVARLNDMETHLLLMLIEDELIPARPAGSPLTARLESIREKLQLGLRKAGRRLPEAAR